MAKKNKVAPEFGAEPESDVESEPDLAAKRKELRDRLKSLKEASQAPGFVPAESEESKAINAELLALGAEPQNDVEARLKRQMPKNADKYAKK